MENQDKHNQTCFKLVGAKIKRVRESRSMTRDQVISRMENPCSMEELRQYEDGNKNMDLEVFFDLTRALCVTPNDITPKDVMERSESGLGDYSRLNSRNKRIVDDMMVSFLKSQRNDIGL